MDRYQHFTTAIYHRKSLWREHSAASRPSFGRHFRSTPSHRSLSLGHQLRGRSTLIVALCGWPLGGTVATNVLLMALVFAAMDWALHAGLGFGLNEVYIMTAHWAYVLPLSLAALFVVATGRKLTLLRIGIGSLTLWLYAWNLFSMVDYLLNH